MTKARHIGAGVGEPSGNEPARDGWRSYHECCGNLGLARTPVPTAKSTRWVAGRIAFDQLISIRHCRLFYEVVQLFAKLRRPRSGKQSMRNRSASRCRLKRSPQRLFDERGPVESKNLATQRLIGYVADEPLARKLRC